MAITVVGDHALVTLFVTDWVVVVAPAPVVNGTDTSNVLGQLTLVGSGTSSSTPPVATPPFTSSTVRVDKAVALPNPVLVKGRPT